MNDLIDALGSDRSRLLEVHTIDPIPATLTVHRATNATTWVEFEVNLTSISPPRQIVLRIDQRALQRIATTAADAESEPATAGPPPSVARDR